jgi:GT2 family glycosyltransferase
VSSPPGVGAPRAAVVIVSYNSQETLPACLDSLARPAGVPLEVVVVDNASTDASAAIARSHPSGPRLVVNAGNLGFACACNRGLRETSAPLVLFLNPDSVVAAGAVETMAALLESRSDVAVVGPLTHSADGTIQVSTGPDLGLRSERKQRRLVAGVKRRDPRILLEAEALHAREREAEWVSASCLMARRQALLGVGGFDEGFFLYEEDADLCRRLRAAGWRVVFTPSAEVRHTLGHSMAQASRRARIEYHRSHLRYYRKHNGAGPRALLRVLLACRGVSGALAAIARADADRRRECLSLVRLALDAD